MARHSGLKDPPEVTASAQIQSLAWDYPYAKDVAIKKKKKTQIVWTTCQKLWEELRRETGF